MSCDIWTGCAGGSRIRPLRLDVWRFVEAQHQVSTRKLVDTLAEQAVLEDLIEAAKPPDRTQGRLHYLLATPFRYPPLRHGSRFGGRFDGFRAVPDARVEAAAAEVAYYRFVFLEGSRADLGTLAVDLTAFTTAVRTARGLDLTVPPFAAHRARIASPTDYRETQALGGRMREAGVEAFRYPSARLREGINVGVLSPAAFRGTRPRALTTWHCLTTPARVELVRRDYFESAHLVFERGDFLVDGQLPAAAPRAP